MNFKLIYLFTALFPVWISICAGLALWDPHLFLWFKNEYITFSLGMIMLFMGLTLKVEDFKRVVLQPLPIFVGVFLQFTVMPLSGFLVSRLFDLPAEFQAGLILVACCPGGTASNVLTFLAKADVALSVTLTIISTFLAIFLTPFLTSILLHSVIEVNAMGLFYSTLKVVVIPVICGVLISSFFSGKIEPWMEYFPLVSTIFIILIVCSVIASSRSVILESGVILGFAVFTVHSLGFLFGYILARIFFKNEKISRTISIEVGMQNSGLGVVLAKENFSSHLVSVPPAMSSLFHSLISSVLVVIWRYVFSEKEEGDKKVRNHI